MNQQPHFIAIDIWNAWFICILYSWIINLKHRPLRIKWYKTFTALHHETFTHKTSVQYGTLTKRKDTPCYKLYKLQLLVKFRSEQHNMCMEMQWNYSTCDLYLVHFPHNTDTGFSINTVNCHEIVQTFIQAKLPSIKGYSSYFDPPGGTG